MPEEQDEDALELQPMYSEPAEYEMREMTVLREPNRIVWNSEVT